MKYYATCEVDSLPLLTEMVTEKLNEGWVLAGGVAVIPARSTGPAYSDRFLQAMTLDKP